MADVLPFVVMAVVAVAIWGSLNWILGPLNRAAENRQAPIQYGLADLLCLFVLVQLPAGIVHWVAGGNRFQPGELVADCIIGLIAALLWWNTARTLSRVGVYTVWRRCLVLTLVLPGVIACPIALIVLPVVALSTQSGEWLILETLVVGIVYGLGRFTRAVVASTKEDPQNEKPT